MADENTLTALARHLVTAIRPLEEAVQGPERFAAFMLRIGWQVDSVPPQFSALAGTVRNAVNAFDAFDDGATLAEIHDVIDAMGDAFRDLKAISAAPVGVDPADVANFLSNLALNVFELLFVEYLAEALPTTYNTLLAVGVIEKENIERTATRPGYLAIRLDFDRIPEALTEPHRIPERVYGWGSDDFDFESLAGYAVELFTALGWDAYYEQAEEELGEPFQGAVEDTDGPAGLIFKVPLFMDSVDDEEIEVALGLMELPPETGKTAGFVLLPVVPSSIDRQVDITDQWKFSVSAGTDIAQQLGVIFRPDEEVEVRFPFAEGAALPSAGFGAALEFLPDVPLVIIGETGKSRLEFGGGRLELNLNLENGELDVRLDAGPREVKAVISTNDADGFLKELFGGTDLVAPAEFGLAWSNRTGFSFTGGLGFEVSVYPHLDLGPISIDRLDLAVNAGLGAEGPASLNVSAGTALSGELGPLAFSTEGIGIELKFLFQDGNAGPFDIAFGFKPPTSLGIVVDAGPVTGGGFLGFDHPRGRYEGIIELSIYSISVSAIGLLDTQNEAGEDLPAPGFSFLIIISVEFTPIQLGFGFTLNGVGGLAGIHRTIVTEALQAGLREGTLDHILFPQDPVRNAPQIISDLRIVFPVAVGRFVFGPMAKLGWGTPSVITAELGIILELPDPFRIVILGQGAALLPEDAPIIRIRVDVLGIIDFALEKFSIDASIRDSYVGAFALSGDMAMRLKWGGRPNFALSVGGLNPGFAPPPNFPTLRRVMVSLGLGDNPRISLQAYLAVTSNSFQIGALAELYAAAGSFNVYGYLGFDALMIFDPFFFRFEFRAGFALRKGTRRIAGITVKGMLSGPSPFHVKGEGCVSLFFFDICVPFDATFGNREQVSLPEKNPWDALSAAIADQRNWTPVLPDRQSAGVTFQPTTEETLFVHPMGRLSFRQRVVPFNKTLERFGEFAVSGANRFDIRAVTIGDKQVANPTLVKDYMAPGLSEDLSDREKVSRDSFELEVVGVEAGSTNAEFGAVKTKIIEYEQKIIEVPWRARLLTTVYTIPRAFQIAVAGVGAKAHSLVALTGRNKFSAALGREPGVRLGDDQWVIADAETLTVNTSFGGAMTKGEAMRSHKAHIKAHPDDAARLEVVSVFETREAA